MIEQVSSKCVTQCVRRDRHGYSGLPGMLFDSMPKRLPCHQIPSSAWKHHIAGLATEQLVTGVAKIACQPVHGLLAQRHQALLVSFTEGTQDALAKIDLLKTKFDQLRDPQAGCIEDFEHRPVA